MSSSLIDAIRSILLNDWDPLGVGDNVNLADEYDYLIPVILRLVHLDFGQIAIEEALKDAEIKLHVSGVEDEHRRFASENLSRLSLDKNSAVLR